MSVYCKAFDDMKREEGIRTGNKSLVYKYSAEEGSSPLMDDLKARVKDTENRVSEISVNTDVASLCY